MYNIPRNVENVGYVSVSYSHIVSLCICMLAHVLICTADRAWARCSSQGSINLTGPQVHKQKVSNISLQLLLIDFLQGGWQPDAIWITRQCRHQLPQDSMSKWLRGPCLRWWRMTRTGPLKCNASLLYKSLQTKASILSDLFASGCITGRSIRSFWQRPSQLGHFSFLLGTLVSYGIIGVGKQRSKQFNGCLHSVPLKQVISSTFATRSIWPRHPRLT